MPERRDDTPFKLGFDSILDVTGQEYENLCSLEDGKIEHLAARKTIVRQGGTRELAYIVKMGWLVEQRILRDGRRQIQNFRLPGEIVGLDGLTYTKSLYSVAALTEAELIPLPLDRFETLHREAPRLATVILVQTLRTEVLLREWEVSLGRRHALERLIHLLLELHARLRIRGFGDEHSCEMPVTQQELADCLGLTTVYVNRLIKQLRQRGLAEIEGRTLILRDVEALRKAAGFDPSYLLPPSA